MTREEIYASIYTHEEIYRPPQEENCACLEVALGCSWGKCLFCDFAKDRFQVHSMAKIEWNLRMLGRLEPEKTRLFLLGENAFCLSFEQLSQIFALAKTFMPNVREFAMYARIDDVLRKTPEELRQLREMGLSDLHIGVESGSDPILLWMNKGVTSFEMLQAFKMLDRAEIGYFITIILGLGGKNYRNLHAIETANLLNRIHPKCVWALKLKIWEDTPLEKMVKKGEFVPMSNRDILFEAAGIADIGYLLYGYHRDGCADHPGLSARCKGFDAAGYQPSAQLKVKNTLPFLKWWRVFCSSQEENLKKTAQRVSKFYFSCDKIIEEKSSSERVDKVETILCCFSCLPASFSFGLCRLVE